MACVEKITIEKLLEGVRKPARYIGGELNSIVKDQCLVRMAISYPDLYEVAMSNNGIRILYDIVNRLENVACERVFAVAADFEDTLRNNEVPLFTLETYTPLNELDLVGFNISHELLSTNILQILDLGHIPLLQRDRAEGDPIVIGGGSAASNPFPLSDFFDAFFIGDGEEGILDILAALTRARQEDMPRTRTLELLDDIEGILVPSRYQVRYEECAVTEVKGDTVRKRISRGPGPVDPVKPIVPNIRITQDRAVVEVTRGCKNFCHYCHAGYYELPYRSADAAAIADRIFEIVENTGYDEVTLSSLSISDYHDLVELINLALPGLTERGISVSLPSLRVDPRTLPVIERVSELRKTSLTFAIESATREIREQANKRVDESELLEIVNHLFQKGWRVIKFYFMVGLPGSEDHDEAGDIVLLLKRILDLGGRNRDINVTISPFVPKPHTPFQWSAQRGMEYFEETVLRVKQGLPRRIKIKSHDIRSSVLEGVLSRGDGRLGEVIYRSYRDGCRFDSWKEHFDFPIWQKNLDEALPCWQDLLGVRVTDEALPWDVVETGFEKIVTKRRDADCRDGAARPARSYSDTINFHALEESRKRFEKRYASAYRVRIRFTKIGMIRYISHMDYMEIIKRGLRMAGVPMTMTQGFNKRERISAGYPVPLGIESECETCDVELYDRVADDLLERLSERLPKGIAATDMRYFDKKESIMAVTRAMEYRVESPDERLIGNILKNLESGVGFSMVTKKGEESLSFEDVVHSYEQTGADSLLVRFFAGNGKSIRVDDAIRRLAEMEVHLYPIRVTRTRLLRSDQGELLPLV